MRRTLMLVGLALVAGLGLLWLTGALDGLARWLAVAQRGAQDQLAGAIRALRAGEAGALAAFWAICFGYGVLHAAGPGHGKLIIGGYGVARQVPVGRLAGLALASSLAQAAVAVGLVYALVAVLGLTRGAVETAAEDWVTPVGHAMIAGLGLWLVWRGIGGLRRMAAADACRRAGGRVCGPWSSGHDHHHHDHHHGHHASRPPRPRPGLRPCPWSDLEQVAGVRGFRDGLALVAGIALRPCSGALFVLILTWQLGIGMAGVIGAFVMGLGTAAVTIAVAAMAVWAREGAFAGLAAGPGRAGDSGGRACAGRRDRRCRTWACWRKASDAAARRKGGLAGAGRAA